MSSSAAATQAAIPILRLNEDILYHLVKMYDEITGADAASKWLTWGDQVPSADAAIFTGGTYFWQLGWPNNPKAGLYVGPAPWGYHNAMFWIDPGEDSSKKGKDYAETFAKRVAHYFDQHGLSAPKAAAK
jgi:hypothetical protein